jgi:hypothetical protein
MKCICGCGNDLPIKYRGVTGYLKNHDKKGKSSPLKNTKFTADHCAKISKSQKERYKDDEEKKKSSMARRKYFLTNKVSQETRSKMSKSFKGRIPWNKGLTREVDARVNNCYKKSKKGLRKVTEETKAKISEALRGEKSYLWKGGIGREEYGIGFNNQLKKLIRTRDEFTCQECYKTEVILGRKLDVHHIDYDKKNHEPKNLISLCVKCHCKTSFKRSDWTMYYKNRMNVGG